MASDPIATAKALAQYGPGVARTARRSQYLSDALKALSSEGGQIKGGYGELGAKLLAQAILQRASTKAEGEAAGAFKQYRDDRLERLLAGLPETPAALPALGPGPAMEPPAPPAPIQPAPQQPPLGPQLQSGPPAIDPQVDAMVRTVWGEARGERPEGQAAVAGVILNRAKERGLQPRDVVLQPGQFEPWGNPQTRAQMEALTPDSPEYQSILANIAPALQGQNPVGGADHFFSPGAQAALGRAPPAWAKGPGQDMGRHRFFDLEQPQQGAPEVQMTAAPAPAQPPQIAQSFPGQPGPQGPQPSAPVSSPPGAGAPPAAQPPQASAAGGMPSTYQPTPQEVTLVRRLMGSDDPTEQAQGEKLYWELQQKMTQPVEWDVKVQDGFVIATNPRNPSQRIVTPVAELQHRRASAEELGIPAPKGTTYDVAPSGQPSKLYEPPTGFQTGPQGAPVLQPTGPAALEVERQLRTDMEKAPEFRAFGRSTAIYNSMKQDYGTPGRIADINFVYGLATIFDPDSVVREGEQVVIRNSQSLPDWLVGQINRVNGGQGIQQETRAQMLETAGTRVAEMQRQVGARVDFTRGIAERYGIDPRNVLPPLPEFSPWKRPTGADENGRAPIPEAARTAYQRLYKDGRIDPQAPVGTEKNPYQARDAATLQALDTPANRGKYVITPNGDLGVID